MFVFDAFSFSQVTFIFWILLGLSAALLRISEYGRYRMLLLRSTAGRDRRDREPRTG